ncbi:MAG: sugar ABC transporter substrate-binding protein [Aeromicrobium sp.]
MKMTRTAAAASASVLLMSLAACGSSEDSGASGGDASCSVGFANPTGQNTYTGAVVDAIKIKVEAKGCEFTELDAKLDVSQQISDVQTLITKGVDALVIYPLDYASEKNVLEKAKSGGIAVFGDNADITAVGPDAPASPLTGQVIDAHLNVEFVKARFEYLASVLPGGAGEIVYVGAGLPIAPLDKEWELTQEVAKDYPDIKIIDRVNNPSDDVAGAQSPAAAALSKYPDMDGFISYNDPSAIGAAAAIKNAGRTDDVFSVGAQLQPEGLAAIENGSLIATFDFTPVQMGSMLADLIIAAIDGDTEAASKVVEGGYELYTEDNIGDFVSTEDQLAELEASVS